MFYIVYLFNMKIIITENQFKSLIKKEEFIKKIDRFIEPPYFYSLKSFEVPEHLWEEILSDKLNQDINQIYVYGNEHTVYDSYDQNIYFEEDSGVPYGYWVRREYDSYGNIIYFEEDGYWKKSEFDSKGNEIYTETSNGVWEKKKYDSNGNMIYFEKSNGYWEKKKYDSNGKDIYIEKSDGRRIHRQELNWGDKSKREWEEQTYGSDGNLISYKNSKGKEVYYEYSNGKLIRTQGREVDPITGIFRTFNSDIE